MNVWFMIEVHPIHDPMVWLFDHFSDAMAKFDERYRNICIESQAYVILDRVWMSNALTQKPCVWIVVWCKMYPSVIGCFEHCDDAISIFHQYQCAFPQKMMDREEYKVYRNGQHWLLMEKVWKHGQDEEERYSEIKGMLS